MPLEEPNQEVLHRSIKDARRWLQTIVESSSDAIVAMTLDRRIVAWNTGAETVFGYTAAEACGQEISLLAASVAEQELIFEKIRRNEPIENYKTVRRAKGGELIDVLLTVSAIKDGGGEILGVTTIVRKVSDREKPTAARLPESEERFRAMFEGANVGIVLTTLDGRLLLPNPGFCKIIGYREEEIARLFLRDITHPDDYEKEAELTRQLLAGEIPGYSIEKRYIRKDGAIVWGSMSATLVRQRASEPFYVLAVVENITTRKLAEEALRKSEERMQIAIKAAELGTWEWNLTTNEVYWNEQHFLLFGMTPHPNVLTPKAFFAHVESDERERLTELLSKAVREKGVFDTKFRARLEDGSTRWMNGYGRVVEESGGQATRISGVMFDITQRHQAEEAMRSRELRQKLVMAQENERKRIARDLHDELGQQLTALRLQLETVSKLCEDDKLRGKIDEMQVIAKSIDNGVDLLARELRPAALDDLGLTAALEKYVKEWSQHSGVAAELLVRGLKKVRMVPEIETNLYRIVQEALNNTHKHAKARNAEVLIEKRGDLIVLIIEDDGSGFDVKNKNNRRKAIGLTGMQERAELVNGTLEIESASGRGTTVYARVPFMSERRAAR